MRACPLRPGLTASLGGVASAAASVALLAMIHPFDATADDLVMHGAGVLAIVVATRLLAAGTLSAYRNRAS
jgi:hypothetical protein